MFELTMKAEILEILYNVRFQSVAYSVSRDYIFENVSGTKNDISKILEQLKIEDIIDGDEDYGSHAIEAHGMDVYETLPAPLACKRIEQRAIILKVLKESYDKDMHHYVDRGTIFDKLGDISSDELFAHMVYLQERGFIEFEPYNGINSFDARLLPSGEQYFEQCVKT